MAILTGVYVVATGGISGASRVGASEPVGGDELGLPVTPLVAPSSTTSSGILTTPTSAAPLLPSEEPPPHEARYTVPLTEAAPEAKQLAVDIAYFLTTYEASDDHANRLRFLRSGSGLDLLAHAAESLIYGGSWSRGQVIYPQLGGLTDEHASVMVVTRQTVGSGSEAEFSVVRTLDIRLVLGLSGWEFDFLSSAGGTFDRLEDLTLAHAVANDPRIEMPDSARLDIRSGLVSPILLRVMADLADRTSYGVVVLATGHPYHVFGTERQSHHTVGRAVDIHWVGDRLVINDRGPDSATRAIVEWLYGHPDVLQVGSPWDLDGTSSRRSFTNEVHQDHIHLAVIEEP